MDGRERTRKLTLTAMVTALNLLFLYASEVLTGTRVIFCFMTALFVQTLLCEGYGRQAFLSYLATVLLGFLLCPNRLSWFFYTALLGHYGIVRQFFRRYITVSWVRSLFTVLYCNLGTALAVWALYSISGVDIRSLLPELPLPMLIIIGEGCFFFMDVLYEASVSLYLKRFRRLLFPKR